MKYKSLVITGSALLILALPFTVKPYIIFGDSMEPTYRQGDVLIISRLPLPPSRGAVIVFRNPHEKSVIEIKRVVGLPSEDVTIGQNNVTVVHSNGVAETFGADTAIGRGQTDFFHIKLGPADYFVLGDNRSKSSDSRAFGAVQKSDFIGIVLFRL